MAILLVVLVQEGEVKPDGPTMIAVLVMGGFTCAEIGKRIPQVALNWLLRRPTVASVIVGARDEAQLLQNLGAVGWALTPEQVAKLDAASAVTPVYPYWHQRGFAERNPPPV